MYPNLYFAFRDLLGVELPFLKLVNSFGFFVALAFIISGFFIRKEFIRLTSLGIFSANKVEIIVGKPASLYEIGLQALLGFFFGWKFIYLAINAGTLFNGDSLPQSHLFSSEGSVLLGVLLAVLLGFWRWWEGKKSAIAEPKKETISVPPSDHIGGIITVAALGGIMGAKLFHLIEYPDQFIALIKAPSLSAFIGGLTMYGGLFVGGLSVWAYARYYGFKFLSVADATAPSLMLGYGIGRIGCQISGDGDWGIPNLSPQPGWLNWLPDWTWSYHFPNNVNRIGKYISDSDPFTSYQGYGTFLDQAVFPTSLYETTISIILFIILWKLRTKLNVAGSLFAIYLIMNGFERFWIEKIRVNTTFDWLGMTMTQAELIAVGLMTAGIAMLYILQRGRKAMVNTSN